MDYRTPYVLGSPYALGLLTKTNKYLFNCLEIASGPLMLSLFKQYTTGSYKLPVIQHAKKVIKYPNNRVGIIFGPNSLL